MKTTINSDQNKVEPRSIDVAVLHKQLEQTEVLLGETEVRLDKKERQIEQLLDYIQLIRHKQFGRTSEKANKDQINLFDEAELDQLLNELETLSSEEETDKQETEDNHQQPADGTVDIKKKRKPVRRPLPAHFNRIEKIIDVSAEEKVAMGDDWQLIGYDTSEQLSVIPRQHFVTVTKRAKYAPVHDDVAGAEQGLKTAKRPDQIIPKAMADHSVIADVITSKFVDGLPLYRQEKIYQRDGIDLSRQTMSGWVVKLEEKLSPLMQVMKQCLYDGKVVHIDETRLQVLNEPDKKNTQLSYMWVYKGGSPDRPVILFQYADTRSGSVPVDYLYSEDSVIPEHELSIMTDGYAGYNALASQAEIKHHAVCWAHARRKFIEASKGRKNTAAAHQMVVMIGKLYQIEREAKEKTAAERKALRQKKAKPIMDKIKTWLDKNSHKVLPKSLLGKALHYTLNLWPQLTIYLEEGHIPIDNNPAENAIRPFVIGRKAWLFSGSPRGAKASATLYSLVETAKANNVEPRAYLTALFEQLPTAKTEQAIIDLLPQNIKMSGEYSKGK